MSSKNLKWRVSLFLLLWGVVAARTALAGSAVIGSVAGSRNATIGGQVVLPNTTIVSGDSLQVNNGAAVVAVDGASRMVFGRDTTAAFLRSADEVTVLLSRGSLSMYHPGDGGALRVKVGDLSVMPARGFKTLGEVAMVGGSVVVTAKEGSLRVEGNGSAVEVARGKTITLPTTAARASSSPRPAAGAVAGIGWQVASVAAGGTSAVLSGVAISHANSARDAANSASTAASAASTAATQADADAKAATAAATAATAAGTAATTAANTADADAIAATAAANAATTAAVADATIINAVGCAIDKVNPNVTVNGVKVSPYTPPAGKTCS